MTENARLVFHKVSGTSWFSVYVSVDPECTRSTPYPFKGFQTILTYATEDPDQLPEVLMTSYGGNVAGALNVMLMSLAMMVDKAKRVLLNYPGNWYLNEPQSDFPEIFGRHGVWVNQARLHG